MSPGENLRPHISTQPLSQLLQGLADTPLELADVPISGVSVDSQDMAPGWAFVGIRGDRHHGARFAQQALDNGAAIVITDAAGSEYVDARHTVIVENPRTAAAVLATRIYHPNVSQLALAAVTGTNGKTTTSHMLRSALARKFGEVALMATGMMDVDNNPEYMLRTTAEAPIVQRALATAEQKGRTAAVIEVSAHAMSLHRLDGLKFKVAVFTNLQHDHLDYYSTMENYFEAKASLFTSEHAETAVICVDDDWGQLLAERCEIPTITFSALSASTRCASTPWASTPWASTRSASSVSDTSRGENSSHAANHWSVTKSWTEPGKWGTSFILRSPTGEEHSCFCPVPGQVNLQNAAAAILAAVQMGVEIDEAIAGVAATPAIAGRMELIRGDQNRHPDVLVDYAHTPEAFAALLETVRPLVTGKIIMVFGTDGDRDASKREELGAIAARLADTLWVTDENPRFEDPQEIRNYLLRGIRSVRPGMENVTEVIQSRRDAVRMGIQAGSPGDLVVIPGKGSEAAQEIQGVFHAYSDTIVAREVLSAPL